MILSNTVILNITPYNIKKYSKYFPDININDNINLPLKYLPNGSHIKIDVSCDCCNKEKEVFYFSYNKIFKKYNKYICNKCVLIEREKTCIKKYGKKHVLSVDGVREKIKKTTNDRYGVDYPAQNKDILKKIQNTNIEKYGFSVAIKNEEIKKKIINTNLIKYGSISSLGNSKIKEKCIKTMNDRYGVDYSFQNKVLFEKSKEKSIKTKINNIILKNDEIIDIDYDKMVYICYCKICNKKYNINTHVFNQRKKVYNTNTCIYCNKIGKKYSDLESELFHFIEENYKGEIIKNKKIINPYELDIYLPDLNLAFEFNGLYWHNELNKPNDYHKTKTDLCLEKDIQLIHIYEDDWLYKQDIIKSIILNKIGKSVNKIYGRVCEIKEIDDNKLIRKFLEENHIQGFVGSSIKLGLFYDKELVSFMTFGKFRKVMNSQTTCNEYEMLRFCNKLNTIVIGGASKLFKYFIKTYKPKQVISYADRSYSNGNLYKQLEFELSHITKPNYYYIIDRKRYHRYNFRKDLLLGQGFDSSKSEHDIMLERRIYRIYNSGNYKFMIHI